MQLNDLIVFHIPKNQIQEIPRVFQNSTFFIDTCQRWVWISHKDLILDQNILLQNNVYEIFEGSDAYFFLLRFACGLESQIIGETDIFGQLKVCWKQFSALQSSLSRELFPWIQKIFEDTKKIRTSYLQNLGGASYGTLVRKLIQEKTENTKDKKISSTSKTLILGAGQLAHSVAPFFLDHELLIWNRNSLKSDELTHRLLPRSKSSIVSVKNLDDLITITKKIDYVIFCIPPDPLQDFKKIELFLSKNLCPQLVIHLGLLEENANEWKNINGFHSLSDIFKLQKKLDQIRSFQANEAIKACEHQVKLRASSSIPTLLHAKSEDLALFA